MKKSYIKLSILMLVIFIIFVINWLWFKIGNRLVLTGLLLLVLVMIKMLVGFEKNRYRYVRQIFYETTIFLLIFFIGYYILGLVVGFYKVGNYYNLNSLIEIILPIIGYTITKEITRYYLGCKLSENKFLLVISCILFIMFDINIVLLTNNITGYKSLFFVVAHSILPIITQNILCTYVAIYYGYKTNIYYMLVMMLFGYLIPIVPNPNDFLYSVIFFIAPLVLLYRVVIFTKKTKVEKLNSQVKGRLYIYYFLIIIVVLLFIYLVSGYFRYYSIAIASGSMEPTISRGDVVIIDKEYEFDKIQEGMIIAFLYNKIVIVHRVDSILKDGDEYLIYTKGDANKNVDNYKVTEDMIVGVVRIKIPIIGYPTVWLNEG